MAVPPEGAAIRMHPDDGVPGGAASDEELVARARRDPGQFGALYARYAGAIHAFVAHRTGDPDTADDVTSQVFTRALAALPRYHTGPFRGWLYAIARNILIDTHRRTRPFASIDAAANVPSRELAPEDGAIAREAHATLMAALDRLTATQRGIVLLRLQGLTGQEIADDLGMTYAAVKSAQYRAFDRLRETLGTLGLDPADPPGPSGSPLKESHDERS